MIQKLCTECGEPTEHFRDASNQVSDRYVLCRICGTGWYSRHKSAESVRIQTTADWQTAVPLGRSVPRSAKMALQIASIQDSAYLSLYSPAFDASFSAMKLSGGWRMREPVFEYLTADLFCFHSGYVKSRIFDRLHRHSYNSDERELLIAVVRKAALTDDRRERIELARAMARKELLWLAG